MAQLNFITTNPYTTSFNQAVDTDRARRKGDLDLEKSKQDLAKTMAMAPFEVRDAQARAQSSESSARVAAGTETSKIEEAGNLARSTGTAADTAAFNLGEAQATAPDRRTEVAAQARGATTAADTADFNLGQAKVNAPIKTQQEQAQLDQTKATTANTRANTANTQSLRSYELFSKAMEALAKGQVDIAQQYAAQAGKQISPQILKDSRIAEAIDKINKDAARKYPNRPADQMKYSQAAVAAMMNKLGELNYDPVASVAPSGAPEAPEQTYAPFRNSVAAGSSGGMSPSDTRLVNAAVKANQKPSPSGFGAAVLDNKGVARALMNANPPRPDLAKLYDPTIAQGPTPTNFPGAETASPISTSMPMPQQHAATPASYDDGQTKGTFSNQYDPKGSPIYVTPEGRRFVVEP